MDLDKEKQKMENQMSNLEDSRSLPVLTKDQLIERALEAEKAIAHKNFISLQDLEIKMRNW